MKSIVLIAFFSLIIGSPAIAATSLSSNQFDDFSDGTTMNWTIGPAGDGGNFITTNETSGGVTGNSDNFLASSSHGLAGGFNAGDRMVIYNQSQWAGDYISAGISSISMDLQSFSGPLSFSSTGFSNDLDIRIAIQSTSGTIYSSNTAFDLDVDGLWHSATFDLADLTLVQGTQSLSDALSKVATLRILSAATGPAWRGDSIEATIGVDNISAVPLPGAVWLFGSTLLSLFSYSKKNKSVA